MFSPSSRAVAVNCCIALSSDTVIAFTLDITASKSAALDSIPTSGAAITAVVAIVLPKSLRALLALASAAILFCIAFLSFASLAAVWSRALPTFSVALRYESMEITPCFNAESKALCCAFNSVICEPYCVNVPLACCIDVLNPCAKAPFIAKAISNTLPAIVPPFF